jgi:hypothetical protein
MFKDRFGAHAAAAAARKEVSMLLNVPALAGASSSRQVVAAAYIWHPTYGGCGGYDVGPVQKLVSRCS